MKGRLKSRKAIGYPPSTSDSISDLVFDVILSAFPTSFWDNFDDASLKIALLGADKRKMKKCHFQFVFQRESQVDHPGTSSKSIKILSRSSLFSRQKIVSKFNRFCHQKRPQKRPSKPDIFLLIHPWGPPGDPLGTSPGPRCRNWSFWRSIWEHFKPSEHQFWPTSTYKTSQKLIPSYIIEFD